MTLARALRSIAPLVALLTLSGAPSAAPAEGGDVADLVAELVEVGSGLRDAQRRAIIGCGPGAVGEVLDILSGRVAHPDGAGHGALLNETTKAVLHDALQAWPARETARALAARLTPDTPLAERLVALRLFPTFAGADELGLWLELVLDIPTQQLASRFVARTLEDTLAQLLARDPRSYVVLEAQLARLPRAFLPQVVGALGRNARGSGLDLLGRLLGRDSALDAQVLVALRRLDLRDAGAREEARGLLRPFLFGGDPSQRGLAATSLGEQGDAGSSLELIALLGDTELHVQRGARAGLVALAGLDHGGGEEGMQRWYTWHDANEDAWYRTRLRISRELASPDPAVVARMLREVAGQRLHRDEAALALAPFLRSRDPRLAALVARTLGDLRSLDGLEPLIEALGDPRDAVRCSALEVLEAWTGLGFGEDLRAWHDWLAG